MQTPHKSRNTSPASPLHKDKAVLQLQKYCGVGICGLGFPRNETTSQGRIDESIHSDTVSCTLMFYQEANQRHKTILYSVVTPDDKEVSRGSTSGRFSALIRKETPRRMSEPIGPDNTQHSKRMQQPVVLKNWKIFGGP